jgi:hypothetical protein
LIDVLMTNSGVVDVIMAGLNGLLVLLLGGLSRVKVNKDIAWSPNF